MPKPKWCALLLLPLTMASLGCSSSALQRQVGALDRRLVAVETGLSGNILETDRSLIALRQQLQELKGELLMLETEERRSRSDLAARVAAAEVKVEEMSDRVAEIRLWLLELKRRR